jgi:hypothetical protein
MNLKGDLKGEHPGKYPEESRHSDPGEAEQIGTDTASCSAAEISKSLTWQGAKSARSLQSTLLALPHIRDLTARSACESMK